MPGWCRKAKLRTTNDIASGCKQIQMKRKMQMAALIRQANSGYELTNKPKIKKKDVWWKRRERKQQQQTLSEKKEGQEISASNVTKAGYT